jgi:hypothetical protein
MPTVPEGRAAEEMVRFEGELWGRIVIVADPEAVDAPDGRFRGGKPTGVKAAGIAAGWLTAVTTTWVATVTDGALNRPELDMLPAVVYQTTPVRFVPVSVALSCKLPADGTSALDGKTWMAALAVWLLLGFWTEETGVQAAIKNSTGNNPISDTSLTLVTGFRGLFDNALAAVRPR